MLKIGVLGAGHLGKIHIKCIKTIKKYDLVGFYDKDEDNALQVEKEFGIKRYSSIDELIDNVDVIDIVTPTISHFELASEAIKKSKHVFIEKPLVQTLEEARYLIELKNEANVKVQVGHVERFNPAFVAAHPHINQPMFIETHRLALFNPRGTDVPVVLDLMIHDLDAVLSLINSNIKSISANGVNIVSDTPDIANARIEFDNGCVANFTASRISMKNMRKTRIFQSDAYIAIDYLKKTTDIIKLNNLPDGIEPDPLDMILDLGEGKAPKKVEFNKLNVKETNAIKTELESFHNAITKDNPPVVSIIDGYKALEVAYKILDKL